MNLGTWDAGADDVDALLKQTAEFQQLRTEGLQLPDGFENEQDAVLAHDLQKLKNKKLPPVAGEIPSSVDATTLKQSLNAGPKATLAAVDSDDSEDEEAAAAKLLASVVEEVKLEETFEKTGTSTDAKSSEAPAAHEPSSDDELERRFLALRHKPQPDPTAKIQSDNNESEKPRPRPPPKMSKARGSDDDTDDSKSQSASESDDDSPRPLVPPGKHKGKECSIS